MIMLSWSFFEQEKTFERVVQAYKSKELSVADLDEKVLRILRAKQVIGFPQGPARNLASSNGTIFSQQMERVEGALFTKGLENISQEIVVPAQSKICVYSSKDDFIRDFKNKFSGTFYSYRTTEKLNASKLEKSLSSNLCRVNIFTIYSKFEAALASVLPDKAKTKLFIINLGSPYFLREKGRYWARLDVLSPYKGAGGALAEFINKKISVSRQESRSPHGHAQSRVVEAQNSRHPSSLKEVSSQHQ